MLINVKILIFFLHQNNDNDWLPDNVFNLDTIFADELLSNVADFGSQPGDLLGMDDVLGLDDSPMLNATSNNNYNNDQQIYSSAASDSGLSSDNLDLYVTNINFITNDPIKNFIFIF